MRHSKYDAAFLGLEPANILSASFFASQGYSVILLPTEDPEVQVCKRLLNDTIPFGGKDPYESHFTHWGGKFNCEVQTFLGFRELLETLDFLPDKKSVLESLVDFDFEVVTPDHKFCVSHNWTSKLNACHKSSDLINLFRGIQFGCTGTLLESTQGVSEEEMVERFLKHWTPLSIPLGLTYFKGSKDKLRQNLLKQARHLGVQLSAQTAQSILFNLRNSITIELKSGALLSAKCLLAHKPGLITPPNTPFSGKIAIADFITPALPSGWLFTMALHMKPSARSAFNFKSLIWQGIGQSPMEIMPLALEFESSQGGFTVLLRSVMPWRLETLQASFQQRIAMRMLWKLEQLVPFSEASIVEMAPDFLKTTPLIFSLNAQNTNLTNSLFQFDSLESIPASLRVFNAIHQKSTGSPSQHGVQSFENRAFIYSCQNNCFSSFFETAKKGLTIVDDLVRTSLSSERQVVNF